jgi:hypothetical protein
MRSAPRWLLWLLLFAAPLASQAQLPGFESLEPALRLDAAQKAQFDGAMAVTQRALLSVGLSALQMKQRLGIELLRDRPDPEAIARAQDELVERNRPLFRAARDEWVRFYAMLDERQLVIAKAAIEERLARLENIGEAIARYLSSKGAARP